MILQVAEFDTNMKIIHQIFIIFLCIRHNISRINPTRSSMITSWINDILTAARWHSFLSIAYEFVTHFFIVSRMDLAN